MIDAIIFWQSEEVEIELTEEEENIKANLQSDDPLTAEILDKIIPDWWNKEPFKWVHHQF